MDDNKTNENKEPVDESKVDWSGLGDAWLVEYQSLLKKHGLTIDDMVEK